MEFQIVYFILLISSAILAIQLALITRKHHKLSFILLMIAIAVWSLGYAVELNSTKISTKLFWIKIQYFGILLAPLSWSIFVFQYLGKENLLTKKNLFLISAIPTITIFLVWTNDFHHLIWKNFNIIYYESFSLIDFEYGIWANLNTAYLYLLTLFAIFLLLRMLIYSYHFYQKQAGFLLISAFTPLIGNAIYVLNICPIDVTPFTFLISGIALSISFSRFRLLDVRPIAIETLIENMKDGVIAIDRYNRIVVANPSAQKIIGSKLVGKFANELLKFHPNMLDYCKSESEIKKEITVFRNKRKEYYELNISPLYDKYGLLGYLIILHDVTERRWAEEAIRKALEKEMEFKLKTAHHFFNPICIAKGYLQLLKKECKRKEIDKAIRAIERIENVIKNIIGKGEIME